MKQKAELETILNKINQLPVIQIKYYLLLILKSIEKEDCPGLVKALEQFTRAIDDFHNPIRQSEQGSKNLLNAINLSFERLCEASELNIFVQLSYLLLDLGSALLALITGTIGGLIGAGSGFIRSLYLLENPICCLADGFIIGITSGAALGFRAPKKLFKNELTRQLKVCLDSLADCIQHLEERKSTSFHFYESLINDELLQNCFKGDSSQFEDFLKEEQDFAIATVHAQFFSENLAGFLGHHARIIFSLPKQNFPTIIEFAPKSYEFDWRSLTQFEKRKVLGKKLIEMMALHRFLEETDACNVESFFTTMKLGERDCFSYVNKILVSTSQNATTLRRFDGSENWIGRNVMGFFVKKLSPFPQDILDSTYELSL